MTEAQAKRKIVPISGNTFYAKTPMALLPFYLLNEHTAVLMDAGLAQDDSLCELFDLLGIRISAVLLSHMHFDHIGGVPAMQQHFGAKVYAPAPISGHCIPMHESVELTECAPEVRQFNESYSIRPDEIIPEDSSSVRIGGASFEVIHCPGHTVDHVAYVTPDNVCYLGDLLISENYLPMMNLLHIENHAESERSKLQLAARRFAYCVAAHKGVFPGDEYGAVVAQNEQKLAETQEQIKPLLQTPKNVDELASTLAERLALAFQSEVDRHTTTCSTRAFLADFLRRNEIKAETHSGTTLYKST